MCTWSILNTLNGSAANNNPQGEDRKGGFLFKEESDPCTNTTGQGAKLTEFKARCAACKQQQSLGAKS